MDNSYSYNTSLNVRYERCNVPDKFPKISKPNIVGCFSLDAERNFVPTAEQLKYIKLPKTKTFRFDLNQGYENVIRKPESAANEKIDHILKFILNKKDKFYNNNNNNNNRESQQQGDQNHGKASSSSSSSSVAGTSSSSSTNTSSSRSKRALNCGDFIAYRGLLRLIMCTPYEYNDDWCILATKYRGNIYLCQRETECQRNQRLNETEISKRLCSYGFKFEQYVLSDDPLSDNQTATTDKPVNEAEEFACAFETTLEGLELFYVAEMDGIRSDVKREIGTNGTDLNDLEFIEVKVKRRETSYNQERNFYKYKYKKWWCQSFLAGIRTIYVGLRNDNGIVGEIQLLDLRESVRKSKEYWSPIVCCDFLRKFLLMIKCHLQAINCPHTVFEYYWDPRSKDSKINYKVHKGENDLSFLPKWYTNEIN